MTILLLAGTAEARALSAQIEGAGLKLITSLAGATNRPLPHGGVLRQGGFGGAGGLTQFIREAGITALIDATHPFASRISQNAAIAAQAAQIPFRQLVRAPWPTRPGWHVVPDLPAAAAAIPAGACALLATGHRSAPAFAGRSDIRGLVRVIDAQPAPCPIPGGSWLVDPPPHDLDHEIATLKTHRITTLVARNSGGAAGCAKFDAADALGCATIVVAPPALPPAQTLGSAQEALAWLQTPA